MPRLRLKTTGVVVQVDDDLAKALGNQAEVLPAAPVDAPSPDAHAAPAPAEEIDAKR